MNKEKMDTAARKTVNGEISRKSSKCVTERKNECRKLLEVMLLIRC